MPPNVVFWIATAPVLDRNLDHDSDDRDMRRTFRSTMSYPTVIISGIKDHWYVIRKVGKKELRFRALKMCGF